MQSDKIRQIRKGVWAVDFHLCPSDEKPMHSFCPVGLNSWCKYSSRLLESCVKTFKHNNKLPMAVMDPEEYPGDGQRPTFSLLLPQTSREDLRLDGYLEYPQAVQAIHTYNHPYLLRDLNPDSKAQHLASLTSIPDTGWVA
ncbi:hypothetical protein TNCV_2437191 [Trichonephila clavipes]|nr:hypothetical protein TNCV_2437191 [Trichonephila clavipes]